jgi:hypothetical protein
METKDQRFNLEMPEGGIGSLQDQTGVEFGDIETGIQMLNKLDYNPVMQAALRDNRTMSDYAIFLPPYDYGTDEGKKIFEDQSKIMTGAMGSYYPRDNMILMESLKEAGSPFPTFSEGTFAHELLHKGAATLRRSGVNLPELYNTSKKDIIRGGKGDKERRAEHRYIQAIVNKAYFDERINNYSQRAVLDLKRREEQIQFYKKNGLDVTDLLKERDKDKLNYANAQKAALMKEASRVMELYMEPEDKIKFNKQVNKYLEISGVKKEDYGGNWTSPERPENLEYIGLNQGYTPFSFMNAKSIFNLANTYLMKDKATQLFKERFESEKGSVDPNKVSELFPTQFADPNNPYKSISYAPGDTYPDVVLKRYENLMKILGKDK